MLWLQLSVHMMVYSDVFHGMHSPLVKVCLNLIEVFDCEGYHWCCFKYVSECIIDNENMPVLINNFSDIC